ncbi:histidine kinase [Oceanirhabdus seepicola]|uniref:Stage 0 sporulation protein A homolog n=1 Tax=Oceanirhabdus seepicola TaxID=2828781 RepID=A0A9J6P0R5_9CLOT|nr:histidine kinase [Oceanirhabdus seepicola]MCM1990131.1 histidine kinase [Oceanirhabdus seepicola]
MRAILVNDCKLENLIMKDILNGLGVEGNIVDELQVFEAVKAINPDIVFVNLVMKYFSGNVIAKNIKKLSKDTICVLCSSSEEELEMFKNEVDHVLVTPINKEKVSSIIRNKNRTKEDDVSTCALCGEKLSGVMSGAKFCPFCGGKL